MSNSSDIYGSYRDALNFSRGKYSDLYNRRAQNAHDFYDAFLKRLVCQFSPAFSEAAKRRFIHNQSERFFGSTEIDFVAVDEHNDKKAF